MRMQLQVLLSNSSNLDERHPFHIQMATHYCGSKNGAVAKYWCRVVPNKAQVCPGCQKESAGGAACPHNQTVTVDKYFKSCKVTCQGKRKRSRK